MDEPQKHAKRGPSIETESRVAVARGRREGEQKAMASWHVSFQGDANVL